MNRQKLSAILALLTISLRWIQKVDGDIAWYKHALNYHCKHIRKINGNTRLGFDAVRKALWGINQKNIKHISIFFFGIYLDIIGM